METVECRYRGRVIEWLLTRPDGSLFYLKSGPDQKTYLGRPDIGFIELKTHD